QTVTLLDSYGAVVSGATTLNGGVLNSATGASLGGLVGNGTVNGNVTITAGHVSPGFGAGQITVNSTFVQQPGSFFEPASKGSAPASGTDRPAVPAAATAVTLGGATLTLTRLPSFTPPQGTTLTLIDNQSTQPITGTFAGLPDNSIITVSGIGF